MADITDLTQYQADREAVKEYYANLLILQYRNKPKARATIKAWADIFIADGMIFQLQDLLDIDKATGATLDLIGKILDCPRIVQGVFIDRQFFQFHVDENSLGFSVIGNPTYAVMRSIQNSNLSEYSLPDFDYRILLKYKAVVNVMRGSQGSMEELLYSVFGTDVILRNLQNLNITYVLASDSMPAILAARKLGYFRAPIGVGLNYILAVKKPTQIFSFALPNKPLTGVGFQTVDKPLPQSTWLTGSNIVY